VPAKPARHKRAALADFAVICSAISASHPLTAAEILAIPRCRAGENSGGAGCYWPLFAVLLPIDDPLTWQPCLGYDRRLPYLMLKKQPLAKEFTRLTLASKSYKFKKIFEGLGY